MITRNEFIELSAELYKAQQHGFQFFKFQDNYISQETASNILEEYRKAELPITEYGKIPDSVAQNYRT